MSEKLSITCIGFRPCCRNTLRGFADVRIEQMHLILHELAVHEKNGKAWAQLPSRPWVKDGQVITDDAGRVKYTPLFEFDSAAVRTAFSDAVIRALLVHDRRALECRESAA